MALTITTVQYDVFGKHRVAWVTAQPAASDYTTGGYAITASELPDFGGLATILWVSGTAGPTSTTPITTTVTLGWDTFNSKLQAFWIPAIASTPSTAQALAEVANGDDLSGWQFNLYVVCSNK